jgi:hypothetical protein
MGQFPIAEARSRCLHEGLGASGSEVTVIGNTTGRSSEQVVSALASAHVQLGTTLAVRYVGRVAPGRMLHLYCAALGVSDRDSRWLKAHVLRAGLQRRHEAEVREARAGLLRFRDWLRVNAAPHGDAPLTRAIERDLARCCELVHGLEARLEAARAAAQHRLDRQSWRPVWPGGTVIYSCSRQLTTGSRSTPITAAGTRR